MADTQTKQLSGAQTLICRMVVNGASNLDIAEHLGLSEETVKVHLKTAFKLLKIKHRTALLGFFSPDAVASAALPTDLDPDERRILDGVASGKTDNEVSRDTGIDIGKIKLVLRRHKERTGTRARIDLAAWWLHVNGKLEVGGERDARPKTSFWNSKRLRELGRLAQTETPLAIRQHFGGITPKMLSFGMEKLYDQQRAAA